MNGRKNAARIVVVLGAVVLIAVALLHLSDYRKDLGAVSASNLIPVLKGGCVLFISRTVKDKTRRDKLGHVLIQINELFEGEFEMSVFNGTIS